MKCFLLWLEVIKGIANILFFIGVPAVALLAYMQAKKTILSPQKQELFKRQLDVFEKVLTTIKFDSKLHMLFKLDTPKVTFTAFRLLGTVREYMNDKITHEQCQDVYASAPSWTIYTTDRVEYYSPVEFVNAYGEEAWNNYALPGIPNTDGFIEYLDKLDKLSASPFLPDKFTEKIKTFKSEAQSFSHNLYETVLSKKTTIDSESQKGKPAPIIAHNLERHLRGELVNSPEVNNLYKMYEELIRDIKSYIKKDETMG